MYIYTHCRHAKTHVSNTAKMKRMMKNRMLDVSTATWSIFLSTSGGTTSCSVKIKTTGFDHEWQIPDNFLWQSYLKSRPNWNPLINTRVQRCDLWMNEKNKIKILNENVGVPWNNTAELKRRKSEEPFCCNPLSLQTSRRQYLLEQTHQK